MLDYDFTPIFGNAGEGRIGRAVYMHRSGGIRAWSEKRHAWVDDVTYHSLHEAVRAVIRAHQADVEKASAKQARMERLISAALFGTTPE